MLLILDATTKSIKASLGGAGTDVNFTAAWADSTATTFTEGSLEGSLNGTTDVVIVAAPAVGVRRVVKSISFFNANTTTARVVTLKYDNGVVRPLAKFTLNAEQTWSSDDQATGGSGGISGLTIGTTSVSGGTAGNVLYNNAGVLGEYSAVPIAEGGTGATSAAAALTALGAYPASNPNGYTSNLGTVTAVTATSPLVSSGGNAPDISLVSPLPAANGGTGLSSPGTLGNVLTSTGSGWQSAAPTGGSGAGNGFKNYLMNGDFRIAQRGVLINSTSSRSNNNDASYTLDRWYLLSDGNNIVTVAQSATAPTPGLNSIALQVVTASKKFGIAQVVESINCYPAIGQTVTLSFKARVSSAANISNVKAAIISWSGTADSITRDIVSSWNAAGTSPTLVANWTVENTVAPANLNVTTSWATYSVTGPIDTANAKNIGVFIWCDALPAATGDSLFIAETQLEIGSTATSFEILPIQMQEQMCYRYFESINNDLVAYATMAGMGYCKTTADSLSNARMDFPYTPFKVKKRIAPAMTTSPGNTFAADAIWLTLVGGVLTGNGASLYIWVTVTIGADKDSFVMYLNIPNSSWNSLPTAQKFQIGAVGYSFANGALGTGTCFINANAEL